jgi:hypothetical protein
LLLLLLLLLLWMLQQLPLPRLYCTRCLPSVTMHRFLRAVVG